MEREAQQEQAFHILVVDDEPDLEPLIRQRMRPHIRSGQYSFRFAGDGNEAVDILSEDGRIDMVVTDINMPGMDGVSDASNAKGEEFGTERLKGLFEDKAPIGAREANSTVLKAVTEFAGDHAQSDDITCLALHRSMTA